MELNERGLEINTYTENVENLTQDFKNIYGDDINVDSNSPDGQMIGIFAQAQTDLSEQMVSLFNSLDPDKATGTALDRVFAFNGIQRKAGTYTYVNEQFTFKSACTLKGLEEEGEENAFTLRDNTGNKFYLVNTYNATGEGTATLLIRAADIGKVEVTPNTITTPVTVELGVASLNNPFPAISTGTNEETDFEFRERRNRSIYAASKGFDESLKSALLTLSNVSYAEVYDNRYGDYTSYGVPLHGVWCVVEGGGNEEVAETIFSKLTSGIPTYGDVTVYVNDTYGKSNKIMFSRVGQQTLYLQGKVKSVSGAAFNIDDVKDYILSNYSFDINETVTTNLIVALVDKFNEENGTDLFIYDLQVSDNNSSWQQYVAPSNIINRFEMTSGSINLTKVESL